jgi:hypothetical protein
MRFAGPRVVWPVPDSSSSSWTLTIHAILDQRNSAQLIPLEWLEESDVATDRSLTLRWCHAFVKTCEPVMDYAPTARSTRQNSVVADTSGISRIGAGYSNSPSGLYETHTGC